MESFWKVPRRLTATKTSHEKMNSYFFQSQSWLFQLAYFVKCKRTLLKLNFYQPYRPYPSSWGDWIVIACLRPPQNVKLGIFRGSRAVDGKEMYKKTWCTCKVVVLPCQAFAYLTFLSPPHLTLPIMSYYLRYTVIRQKQNIRAKFNCSCW